MENNGMSASLRVDDAQSDAAIPGKTAPHKTTPITTFKRLNDTYFDFIIGTANETFKCTKSHEFLVLNCDNENIERIQCKNININLHMMLNFES